MGAEINWGQKRIRESAANAKPKSKFMRTAEAILGAGIGGAGAYFATIGIKNACFGNELVSNAVGNTNAAFDLHDVMFENTTHNVDGKIQWDTLHTGISVYVMVGTVIVVLALFAIMHRAGLKKGIAFKVAGLALVAGGLTAGGFIMHIHEMAGTGDMWLHNPLIIGGIVAFAASFGFAIYFIYKACTLIDKFQNQPEIAAVGAEL